MERRLRKKLKRTTDDIVRHSAKINFAHMKLKKVITRKEKATKKLKKLRKENFKV